MIAHNDAGDSEPSEALLVRTPSSPSVSPPPTPSKPHVISNNDGSIEIGWKMGRTNAKDVGFLLEGSSDEKSWTVLYKGSGVSSQIRDPELRAFRVAAWRKQLQVIDLAIFMLKYKFARKSNSEDVNSLDIRYFCIDD